MFLFFIPKKTFPKTEKKNKICILIPAHNEEDVIYETIKEIYDHQNYPKELYDIYVVADNCTDKTKELAKKAGAKVFIHIDNNPKHHMVGYALEYGLKKLLKIDKEKLTKGLTKEYFEELIIKGDVELLVIKLCVKLEAILKCDYKLVGTFEEMLSKFTSAHGYEDDGWGYSVESRRTILFHKLRKYRNGIVHSEQSKETLTENELKEIIDYICKLG